MCSGNIRRKYTNSDKSLRSEAAPVAFVVPKAIPEHLGFSYGGVVGWRGSRMANLSLCLYNIRYILRATYPSHNTQRTMHVLVPKGTEFGHLSRAGIMRCGFESQRYHWPGFIARSRLYCYGTGLGEGNIYDLTHATGVGSYRSRLECPGRINYIIIVRMAYMRMLRERGSRVNACPRGSAYYATCHLPFVSGGEQRDHGSLVTWYVALTLWMCCDVRRSVQRAAEHVC